MYRNLLKNVGCSFSKSQLLNVKLARHQTDSCYHSENGYFGYRPKIQEQREIPQSVLEARQSQSNLYRWIDAYRTHGHRIASVNPIDLRKTKETIPELDHKRYGIPDNQKLSNLEGLVYFADKSFNNIQDLKQTLKDSYCSNVSAEFTFIEDEFEREWFAENFEKILEQKATYDAASKKEIAEIMIRYEAWDHFLAIKFPSVKRYGGEGAESMVSFFRTLFIESSKDDVEHIVLGMPHRGKLNLLVTMFQQRPAKIFRKFKGLPEFDGEAKAMMDIPNHFNASVDLMYNQKKVHLSMLHNPSHLEAVNPVSMGKARSKQQSLREGAFNDDKAKEFGSSVINVILHGDAAIAGQGINQECLMMTNTPNFEIGGTIHMIVNNQIGYTTPSERGKSSRYCSDIGKSINAPVIHVNGDDPELVGLVSKLAFDYQRKFRKDVFVDFNCFRKYGHNELDDPTFTNPSLYKIIHNRKSIPENYVNQLIYDKVMTREEADKIKKTQMDYYIDELTNVESYLPERSYFNKQWTGFVQAPTDITYWDTGLNYELLSYIGGNSVKYPEDFNIHAHLNKMFINGRLKKLEQGQLDWATAETLAVGSLMYQGYNVRISGEDVGRGTFSQRHAMLVDQESNEMFIPLNQMKGGHGGRLEIANSILSEEAVLGFEYGMSIDNPNNLIIWEAQFGDFFNGAQIIIDTFIASGETKWMTSSGLVMLLPHGYDGMASEHSSCRIERFLQQTDSKESSPDGDDVNMQVINPTTPAQYYHALRRQMIRNFRKPLIVVAPKTLLRLAEATSSYSEFLPGTFFLNVIGDKIANPKSVKKVILCSGKHYYNLNNARVSNKIEDVAIIRVESIAPFPIQELQQELAKYKNAKAFLWSQEEHRNFGCWSFIKPRFESMLERRIDYVGRYEAATPAIGVSSLHHKEAAYVVNKPFGI